MLNATYDSLSMTSTRGSTRLGCTRIPQIFPPKTQWISTASYEANSGHLTEFVVHDADEEVSGATGEEWHYECRCDGTYRVTEDDLECGRHLVGCQSCSEVLWVGYKLVED